MPESYKGYTLNVQGDPNPNGVLENTNLKKIIDKDEALTTAINNLEVNSVRTIAATDPLSVSTPVGQVTISHDLSGVDAGSYQSVTVNETGHVVGGSNSTHNPLYLCEAGHEADLTTVRIWNDSGVVKMQMQSVVGTWDVELWRFERNI
jgi:phage-related tail fiber protein